MHLEPVQLENLNWPALINRVLDPRECLVLRWEAYRLALKDFDWYYPYAEEQLYAKGIDNFMLLKEAQRSMAEIDPDRAHRMFVEAQEAAFDEST